MKAGRKKIAVRKKQKKLVKNPRKFLIKKKTVNKKIAKNKIIKKTRKPVVKKIKKLKASKIKPIKKVPKKSKKKITQRKKRKKASPSTNLKVNKKEQFIAKSFFKAKIKVIGIGGGGGSIVSEIGRSLNKAKFVVADTDTRAFKKRQGIKYFLFGQKLTHGLGTGVNPDLGRLAAEQEKERIAHFFDDQDIVIFIASLGGGLGSGATQVFAETAKNFNGITFGIFTLPFKFEGKNKYKIAIKALRDLRRLLNVSITIPNEKIFKIIDANTAITDAFSIVNKSLIESLESLIDLIYNPGIINIDFADLRAILKGKGNLAFLNTAEANGKHRAEDIAHKILHNPLYQKNNFTAQKILFNIEGGTNLSMFEVDKISRIIAEKNPKSKIIFGISKNPKYKNKIKTTLLMTGGGSVAETVVSKLKIPIQIKKIKKNLYKKIKKDNKPASAKSSEAPNKKLTFSNMFPVFNNASVANQTAQLGLKKFDIVEIPLKPRLQSKRNSLIDSGSKKAIRRSALEIKKAQEDQENKQSLQEKEWEIPAFMRIKK